MLAAGCAAQGPAATATPAPLVAPTRPEGYVDSSPAHGDVRALAPDRVVINFDFSLGERSAMAATKNGAPVSLGQAAVGGLHNLTLSAGLPAGSGDGVYAVTYKACRQDESCAEGRFAFTVDSRELQKVSDMTGRATAEVGMRGVRFDPPQIKVTAGATVIWMNHDPVGHFVNTDPHPSHNHLAGLNSPELKERKTYAHVFSQPGEWRYHWSAHLGMTGSVVVE